MTRIVLLILALGTGGCVTLSSTQIPVAEQIKLSTNEEQMKTELLRHIPIGMNIEEAKEKMEKNRFKCHFGREGEGSFYPERKGEFCLLCSQCMPGLPWGVSDEMWVHIMFEHGKVSDVRVGHLQSCL